MHLLLIPGISISNPNALEVFHGYFLSNPYGNSIDIQTFYYDFFVDRFKGNYELAKRLYAKHHTTPRLNIIAHSNGAKIALLAASMGLPIENLVLFGAAVDSRYIFPSNVKTVYNIYNPKDWLLSISTLFDNNANPYCHAAGQYGFISMEPTTTNILQVDADTIHQKRSLFYVHSDYFQEKNAQIWCKQLYEWFTVKNYFNVNADIEPTKTE